MINIVVSTHRAVAIASFYNESVIVIQQLNFCAQLNIGCHGQSIILGLSLKFSLCCEPHAIGKLKQFIGNKFAAILQMILQNCQEMGVLCRRRRTYLLSDIHYLIVNSGKIRLAALQQAANFNKIYCI